MVPVVMKAAGDTIPAAPEAPAMGTGNTPLVMVVDTGPGIAVTTDPVTEAVIDPIMAVDASALGAFISIFKERVFDTKLESR